MTFLVLQVFATKGLAIKYVDLNQGRMFVNTRKGGAGWRLGGACGR